jgi:hypothetical protein
MSGQIILKMRNVSGESCRENKHHILCSMTFFPKILQFVRQYGKKFGTAKLRFGDMIGSRLQACFNQNEVLLLVLYC